MTRIERIEDFLSELHTDIDILNCIDIDNVSSYNDVYEQIQDNGGFDIEIIYYSNAIKYLSENDPSLNESLEIATEYGYETQNLNSEILASLLASRDARDEFSELETKINGFFTDLDNMFECEGCNEVYEIEEDADACCNEE